MRRSWLAGRVPDAGLVAMADMINPLRFIFAAGEDKPLLADKQLIDRLYKRNRISIMLAITLGYGIAYMCRLGLSVVLAFLLYGFSINGLVTSLGGLFAVDIAPKRVAGAVMGFIGVFSYVGAALQERISGYLIRGGTAVINGVRHYDFHNAIVFWLATSVLSMILAASLWRARISD